MVKGSLLKVLENKRLTSDIYIVLSAVVPRDRKHPQTRGQNVSVVRRI